MNDSSLDSEGYSLGSKGKATDFALVDAPDFADVAESLGAKGYTVRSFGEVEGTDNGLRTAPEINSSSIVKGTIT